MILLLIVVVLLLLLLGLWGYNRAADGGEDLPDRPLGGRSDHVRRTRM